MGTTVETAGATAAVARAAAELGEPPLAARTETVARHCLLDWLGVGLAGAAEPCTAIVAAEAAAGGAGGEATLLGRAERAPASLAALVNGVAAHALDYDDTHLLMPGHTTVPVAAAVVALGERLDSSLGDVLAALVDGVEVECRLGILLNPSHYRRGWHATGTLGTFGAAAAGARLLGCDETARLCALGLAGTQAAGVNASFGTMAKPLNAGKAAMNGLLAATLAAGGFTGATDVVEAPRGFAAVASGESLDLEALAPVQGRALIEDTLFKYHAACYWTHASLEALTALRDEHDLIPDDVEAVELDVAHEALDVADIVEPSTGLQVKFSLRTLSAMVLSRLDTGDPATFTDALAAREDLAGLRERVAPSLRADGTSVAATAVLRTRGGAELSAAVDLAVPPADLDAQGERLREKFLRLAAPVVGDALAARLGEAILGGDGTTPVRELTALAVPGVRGQEAARSAFVRGH